MNTMVKLDVAAPRTGVPAAASGRVANLRPASGGFDRARRPGAINARRGASLTLVAVALLTIAGAVIRSRGFTSLGLFRDDAWVALSSRVGIAMAWRMWVTAPGYGLVERMFMALGPNTTWWSQIPAFVCGTLAVPAIFALARLFRLGRVTALVLALLVCISPVCAIYSTRVKEYSLDFLLSCLLLALSEAARRRPERGPLLALSAASSVAFFASASEGLMLVAVWVALAALVWPDRVALRRVLAAGAGAAVACAALAAAFYSHVSPVLTRFWSNSGDFVVGTSPHALVASVGRSALRLTSDLFGFSGASIGLRVVLLVACIGLVVVALRHQRALLGPALVVVGAFVASVAHVAPLGTGRTDEYLYPALLLLLGAGAGRVFGSARTALSRTSRHGALAVGTLGLLTGGVLLFHAYVVTPAYPAVDVKGLAASLQRVDQPGDHIFVDELMRYPWGLYEDAPLRVEFGSDWSTGFTVVSNNQRVFIAPSEDYEGDARPQAWASEMSAYHRLWFVWTPPLTFSASYEALLHHGWRPVRTITVTGCSATLLVRAGGGAAATSAPPPGSASRPGPP